MKIVALSGEDTEASRNRYYQIVNTLKKRNWEHLSLTPTQSFSDYLTRNSLFSEEVLVTVLDAQKVSTTQYEWVSANVDNITGSMLLYFPGAIPAAIKKTLPKGTKYEDFPLPKVLFPFLEHIGTYPSKKIILEFNEVIETSATELVFALLSKHVKDLYWLKVSPESVKFPDWRRQKLKRQLNYFKGESIEEFIGELSRIDLLAKRGEPLKPLMEILLIKFSTDSLSSK